MAIAFDATSVGSTTGTSLTVSHTCSGSDRLLLVGIKEANNVVEFVSGITYAGVSMTKIGAIRVNGAGGQERWTSLWYLINPTSGTNNIVVTATLSTFMRASGASYTGCSQTSQPDASGTNSSGGSNVSTYNTSLTSIADNCWHVMVVANDAGTQAAGTATTLRGVATDSNIMDSNSAKTPPGSVQLQATIGSAAGFGSVIASIAPVAASGPTNLKTLNGVAKASIKTINGVALASVKSWDGIQ